MTDTLVLTEQLIACQSVTPADGGCQALLARRLQAQGFRCHSLVMGPEDAPVTNLIALHAGARPGPTLAFAGHTDVVPPGPLERWTHAPFVPTHAEGRLYGRGAADMKAAVASMVVACERYVAAHPDHPGQVLILLTSDEEGPALDGTVRLVEWLREHGPTLDACIVGEPTSVRSLGDTVKNGRRGSLSGRLVVRGKQGHIAYPQLARNPVHLLAPALAELAAVTWDDGNDHFPATSWQVSNLHAGTGATNVIPGEAVVDFNFRFSTESTPEGLQAAVHAILDRHGLDYHLDWTLGGRPFLTRPGRLTELLGASIAEVTGRTPELSTTGGTSDGRFLAAICPEVVEFGHLNATIHQVDEHIPVADIEALTAIYLATLTRWLA